MNEVQALVEAFDAANIRGQRCALATVVSVEGSSYRRPGARMLVCENGSSTGTISAGCLESDIIEHAKRVIRTDRLKLVEYNTSSASNEQAWGLGLGCSGVVRVLVEPLMPGSVYIAALRGACAGSEAGSVSVATVYQSTAAAMTGARLVADEQGHVTHEGLSSEMAAKLTTAIGALPRAGATSDVCIHVDGVAVSVFLETLLPPVLLVVFGAGHDALPVIELARQLGWQTEVVDMHARPASRSRFAMADRVTLSRPEELVAGVNITPRTMALLMSHHYSHDLASLRFVLASPARYIGVMGPRERTGRMLKELAATEASLARLHSPVGLDIGANGPAEIALSIIAEMRAVVEGRPGGMLRDRNGSIHGNPDRGECVTPAEAGVVPVFAA